MLLNDEWDSLVTKRKQWIASYEHGLWRWGCPGLILTTNIWAEYILQWTLILFFWDFKDTNAKMYYFMSPSDTVLFFFFNISFCLSDRIISVVSSSNSLTFLSFLFCGWNHSKPFLFWLLYFLLLYVFPFASSLYFPSLCRDFSFVSKAFAFIP